MQSYFLVPKTALQMQFWKFKTTISDFSRGIIALFFPNKEGLMLAHVKDDTKL